MLAILGVAFVLTLLDRPSAEALLTAGSFFSVDVFEVDGDGALIVRGSLVCSFDAVELVGREIPGERGESSPGTILPTSSIASSSASSASMGSSDFVFDKEGEVDAEIVNDGRPGFSVDASLDAVGDRAAIVSSGSLALETSASIPEAADDTSAGVSTSSSASTVSIASSFVAIVSASGLSSTECAAVDAGAGVDSANASCLRVIRTGFASGVAGRASGSVSSTTMCFISTDSDTISEVYSEMSPQALLLRCLMEACHCEELLSIHLLCQLPHPSLGS